MAPALRDFVELCDCARVTAEVALMLVHSMSDVILTWEKKRWGIWGGIESETDIDWESRNYTPDRYIIAKPQIFQARDIVEAQCSMAFLKGNNGMARLEAVLRAVATTITQ
ncbi:hypothetical protein EDD18DRAFT_1106775 [Armillaria luteobubalina]|uniref:Uncharacterized protein n=1 Tax=Armillaria luteobubalina TaxID=153913 RepID=A0AA39Q3G8_9AGAR|nr:hypothetical protein EDD18DRAFT_1106775 [Armillaria luteobubalina]